MDWLTAIGLACVLTSALNTSYAADLPAVEDSYVQSDMPTTKYGSSGILAVSGSRVAFIRFNATTVASSVGSAATLKLKVGNTKNASNAISVRVVQSPWSESTVTYANRPQFASTPLDQKTLTAADTGNVVSFDITAALASWKAHPETNYGIAIVAGTPTPNLGLGSREGGGAAVLTISGAITANKVNVAPAGGDYTNPVTAAKNALTGDKWCVSPVLPTKPCTMTIAAGIYILPETLVIPAELEVIGAEKSETVLVAGKGVVTALNSRAQLLSDLTIANNQDGIARAVGLELGFDNDSATSTDDAQILHVAVTVSGAQDVTGVLKTGGRYKLLSDVQIAARGTQRTVGYDVQNFMVGQLENCSIDASGGSVSNEGVSQFRSESGRLHLRECTVSATGGGATGTALALVLGDQSSSGVAHEVIGSDISARSSASATGISAGGVGVDLLLLDSRVTAVGGTTGTGIAHGSNDATSTLDGSQVYGSTTGVSNGSNGTMATSILRSNVTAGQTAVQLLGGNGADITGSILKAPLWIKASDGGVLRATDSVLDGSADYGGLTKTCTRVYDRNYVLLPATCTAP